MRIYSNLQHLRIQLASLKVRERREIFLIMIISGKLAPELLSG